MGYFRKTDGEFAVKHEPTEEEIREACEKIQKTWSVREEQVRRGQLTVQEFEIPIVSERVLPSTRSSRLLGSAVNGVGK